MPTLKEELDKVFCVVAENILAAVKNRRLMAVMVLTLRYLVTSPPTKSPPTVELSLALFWNFMNENFLTVTLFSYSKEMTTGCATFLPVFYSLKFQS